MKKVFFTALAIVAFSSASMANTIADEEVIVENKKEVKEEKVVFRGLGYCVVKGIQASNDVFVATGNHAAATAAGIVAEAMCNASFMP